MAQVVTENFEESWTLNKRGRALLVNPSVWMVTR